MVKADNFRLVAVGGLPAVMAQIKLWQEREAWDRLIQSAPDYPHKEQNNRWKTGVFCECHLCRPNRRYK